MGCQQGKAQAGTKNQKGGFNRTNTMKKGNNQNFDENNSDKNESQDIKNKNDNVVLDDENNKNKHSKRNSDSQNENQDDNKNQAQSSSRKENNDEETNKADNPPLKYQFTINGKSLKQIQDQENEEEQDLSDILLSTDIREGITPQLSEVEEYLQNDLIYDKKDISLADIGDGMMFEGGFQRKMTLQKAATLKKSPTIKKKMEQKQIIHVSDIQPSRDYFMPDFCKSFTRQATQKNNYNKGTTLFVPQQN